MKILVAPLGGYEHHGWCNWQLVHNLLSFSKQDPRFQVALSPVIGMPSVDYARNCAINFARKAKADWLLMVDNDQSWDMKHSPLEVLANADGRRIVSFLTYMKQVVAGVDAGVLPNHGAVIAHEGDWLETEWSGSGLLAIHRDVWEKIRNPLFQTEYDESGLPVATEDFTFCRKARKNGFGIWTWTGWSTSHFKLIDLARFADERLSHGQKSPQTPAGAFSELG